MIRDHYNDIMIFMLAIQVLGCLWIAYSTIDGTISRWGNPFTHIKNQEHMLKVREAFADSRWRLDIGSCLFCMALAAKEIARLRFYAVKGSVFDVTVISLNTIFTMTVVIMCTLIIIDRHIRKSLQCQLELLKETS